MKETINRFGQTGRNTINSLQILKPGAAYCLGRAEMSQQGAFATGPHPRNFIQRRCSNAFCPLGPVLVTRDEIPNPNALGIKTVLNGEVMQSTKTDDLIFDIAEQIAYFSQWYQFSPGDVVTTGSPSGVGFGRDPKIFMKPGDLVEVELEGVGTLSNRLIAG